MPYLNIPESGLESSIARQVGKLKGNFLETVGKSLDNLEQIFAVGGCPSEEELQTVRNQLNNIKSLSTELTNRLNKLKTITPPLKNGSGVILKVVPILKGLPIPGLALTAGVTTTFSDLLVFIKEFGTQLKTSAEAIDSILSETSSIENLLSQATDLSNRIDTALELCALASNTGVTLDPEKINNIVNGSTGEAGRAIRDLNSLLDADVGEEGLKQASDKLKNTQDTIDLDSYKGFNLRIVLVESDFTRAPKRKAIAIDNSGKIKFESAKSFASSTKVLEEEVKFLIDNSQV